ncbi:MAG: hypothetical protein AVDCRST_MAG34-252, partial [uncultured Nocardioidaceae bacterium]
GPSPFAWQSQQRLRRRDVARGRRPGGLAALGKLGSPPRRRWDGALAVDGRGQAEPQRQAPGLELHRGHVQRPGPPTHRQGREQGLLARWPEADAPLAQPAAQVRRRCRRLPGAAARAAQGLQQGHRQAVVGVPRCEVRPLRHAQLHRLEQPALVARPEGLSQDSLPPGRARADAGREARGQPHRAARLLRELPQSCRHLRQRPEVAQQGAEDADPAGTAHPREGGSPRDHRRHERAGPVLLRDDVARAHEGGERRWAHPTGHLRPSEALGHRLDLRVQAHRFLAVLQEAAPRDGTHQRPPLPGDRGPAQAAV